MRRTWLSLAVTLVLGAAVTVLFPYRAITPGKLAEGHRAQKDDCLSCHTFLAGAPAAKCAACHKPGGIGLCKVNGEPLPKANPRTHRIHQVVPGECDRCHFEHGSPLGRYATLRFAHELLPVEVVAGCAACHAGQKPADALHAAALGECTPCHGTKGWKPATYDHDRAFRFDRDHPPRCADCHEAGASLKDYSCTGCHEHSLDRMEREHREEGIRDLTKCRRCHPSGDEDDTIKEGGRRDGKERERGKREEEDDD